MREPQSWNDSRLLEDEPFLTYFPTWWWHAGRSTNAVKERQRKFSRAVNSDATALSAARVWADAAFKCGKNAGRRPTNFVEIFSEYYWLSFLDRHTRKDEATLYLNKQRRLANCYYEIQVEMEKQGAIPSQTSTQKLAEVLEGSQDVPQASHSEPHPIDQANEAISTITQSPELGRQAGIPVKPSYPADASKTLPTPLSKDELQQNIPNVVEPVHTTSNGLGQMKQVSPLASFASDDLENAMNPADSPWNSKDDMTRSFIPSRPPLPYTPPIWAQSRQELCESFDWFRSYQGGVYHANNAVKGYLLSAFPACRDRFEHEGKLIISHGGGKAESANQPAEDQLAQDKSVRALLSTYAECRPLVLVVDDKYTLFPYDMGSRDVTYAILGFYVIVAAWGMCHAFFAEYQPAHNERGRVVRYKFAFRWCESQGQPWWCTGIDSTSRPKPEPVTAFIVHQPRRMPASVTIDDLDSQQIFEPSDRSYSCLACGASSPHIYAQGWACLNTECHAFWKTESGTQLPDELDYRIEFLQSLSSMKISPVEDDLFSPAASYARGVKVNTGYTFSRGWHCKNCGRLSCRVKLERWECPSCQTIHSMTGRVRHAQEFWQEVPSLSFRDFLAWDQSEIQCLPRRMFRSPFDSGHVQSFILPNGWGIIHHIQNSTERGRLMANNIFEEYQHQANAGQLPFRRWPLRSWKHKLRGPMLTNYFSQNCGVPYQYVGGTANTLPFSKAPGAVLAARKLIRSRIEVALNQSIDFNEVLSAAYMERQRMAFHSDSERGLGPVVAGLSLGAPAVMHFRLLARFEPDQDQRNVVLSLVLRHGDVLVMEGSQLQEHYEHTVVPTNFRIAATARWIDPEQHL